MTPKAILIYLTVRKQNAFCRYIPYMGTLSHHYVMQHVHGIRRIRRREWVSLTHTCVSFLLSWYETEKWVERKGSCSCTELWTWRWCQGSSQLGDALKHSSGEVWDMTLKVTSVVIKVYYIHVCTGPSTHNACVQCKNEHLSLLYSTTVCLLMLHI